MGALRWIILWGLLVLALMARGQDRLTLLDIKHGDTLRLDPARVLEVRSDSLWLHGGLASWDTEQLFVRMKRYRGQHLVDTLVAVPKVDVRELVSCQLKDVLACATYDERADRREVYINKGTAAAVLAGSLLFLFGNKETAVLGGIVAVGGTVVFYGGGHLLANRDRKRFRIGKRWKLL
ncbi:MAG: hypothetical protein KA791_00505 [Flavobacteriales bacterium]|nr:hypothetical protein [Flavobacteriales bacterium]